MANAELKVILSADGKELTSVVNKAESDIRSFSTETKKLPATLSRADNSLRNTSKQFAATGNAVKKSKGDFTNISRVIQDLPFGLIGIQNNLTQLIPGVGLLGLAFSGLITALTFSQTGLSNWTRGSKGAGDSAKKSGEEVETLADKQKRLKEAFDEAAKSMISQTTKAEDLGKALIDVTNKTALLTEATVKQGLAQVLFSQKEGALQKLLSDRIEKQLKVEKKLLAFKESEFKVTQKQLKQGPIRIADEQEIRAAGIGLNQVEQQIFDINKLARSLGISFEQFVDAPKEDKAADKFFDGLIKRVRAFEKFINTRTIRVANFEIAPDEDRATTIKNALDFINRAINDRGSFALKPVIEVQGLDFTKTEKYFQSQRENAAKMLQDLQEEINKLTKRNPILIEAQNVQATEKARGAELAGSLGVNIEGVNQPISLLTDLQKQAVNAANTIRAVLTPAFDDLFNAIKSGENPIKAFFQGIGQAVLQLIQQLIAAAVQALIIQAIFPGLGGAKGGFGNIFKSLLGFKAEGGPVFANKPYVVGERGPELFIPQGGGKIIPNNEMNSGLAGIAGGMQTVRVVGSIKGNDILLSNARSSRSQRRNF